MSIGGHYKRVGLFCNKIRCHRLSQINAENAGNRGKNGGNGETERKTEVKVKKKKGADYIPLLNSM